MKKETEPDSRWRNKKRGKEEQLEQGKKRMIETDGAVKKSGTGKWENAEEEEGECGPQMDRGLVTTNGVGVPFTFFKEAKERFP